MIRSSCAAMYVLMGLALTSACSSNETAGFGSSQDAGLDSSMVGSGGGAGATTSGDGGNGGSGAGAVSNGGTGTTPEAGPQVPCTPDGGCAAGSRCDRASSRCVGCFFDDECGDGESCLSGACVPKVSCGTSRDCRGAVGNRTVCNASKVCVECAADADCGPHRVCAVDTCVDSTSCVPGDAGVDAGAQCKPGQVCGKAGQCVECAVNTDCASGQQCFDGTCRTPCASDNACVSGDQLCDKGKGACVDCTADGDCGSLDHCAGGTCTRDVCAQGVKSCVGNAIVECTANGDGIKAPVACTSGTVCTKAGTNATCKVPRLADGGLPPPATCSDGDKNGDETDVDCGGSCTNCGDRKLCGADADCTSSVCEAACSGLLCFPGTRDKKCLPAECDDTTLNGNETSIDCGGGTCKRCPADDACKANDDCESNICKKGLCVVAACTSDQCPACLFPTDAPCCIKSSGLCGCATVFPFQGACQ